MTLSGGSSDQQIRARRTVGRAVAVRITLPSNQPAKLFGTERASRKSLGQISDDFDLDG